MRLVIQNGSRVWGGNEKWLATLARGVRARGHRVVVSSPPGPVRERVRGEGILTTGHRPRGALDPVSAIDFALWLRRERPDALLLTSWRPLPWAARAAAWAGVPRVVVRLGIERDGPSRGSHADAFRRRVDAMIVNSDEIRARWLRTAPWFPPGRVRVVLNGVADRSAERPALRERLRRELGVTAGTVLVGAVGHLAPRKGFDLLLRACAQTAISTLEPVIVGGGDYGAELRRLALELGIAQRVHWLGARDDGAEVIAGCDLFVLPSRSEGMANVMLEAMAAGVPVIASSVSGVRQALAAEGAAPAAGWSVPAGDADALAAALGEVHAALASHPAAVRARTDEALARVRGRFAVERMVRECEEVLFGPLPGSAA